MIMNMYVFFDRVSQNYMPQIMLIPSHEVCKRGMKKLVNSTQFPHKDIVDDLQLFCVGKFDLETGVVTPGIECMLNLIDLVDVKEV